VGDNRLSAATFLGWTWRAHLDDLHRLVTEERWLEAAKRLSGMLAHALDKAAQRPPSAGTTSSTCSSITTVRARSR
jgi:hypothetical protein